MPARLNAYPKGIVLDRSTAASETNQGFGGFTPTFTVTGANSLMWDSNLTTFQQIQCNGNAGQPFGETILDYGKVFWNTQLSYSLYAYRKDTDAGNMGIVVSYSIDGTNWIDLETLTYSYDSAGSIKNSSFTELGARYLRFRQSFPVFGSYTVLKLYEVRLMGSE